MREGRDSLRLWLSFFCRSLARARLSASGGQRRREVVGRREGEKRRRGNPEGMGERAAVPVSSRFWVRSAGQELLVTPTREAVTWGSPLYTFRWLLDSGSCRGRSGGGGGESSPGPMEPRAAVRRSGKITRASPSPGFAVQSEKAWPSTALPSGALGRGGGVAGAEGWRRNLTGDGIKSCWRRPGRSSVDLEVSESMGQSRSMENKCYRQV